MSKPISRRTLLAAATAAVLATAITPQAVSRADSLARVDIYDRSAGMELPVYRHKGRRYVAGQPGNEYAIRIRNHTSGRLLAVVSVDGVNAVTGESASPDQSGYVLEPGGYVNIQGWRKDLNRTAAFYFSDPSDSYAARTGRPRDIGVIGVALFRERDFERPALLLGRERRSAVPSPQASTEADAAGGSKARSEARSSEYSAAARLPALGTGHGRGEYSPVEQVAFERAKTQPDELIAIRYERRETLVALGVLPEPRIRRWPRQPDPFPGALGFVPDP
jgi:hypothetical protein